jgi:hypothetical protein
MKRPFSAPVAAILSFFALLGAWIVVGGMSGVASAHAEFGQSAVTAGTTSTVTLYVPQEYEGYFNVQVQVQIPNGWQAVGSAGNVLTFSNSGGLGEEFPITLIAPASPTSASAFAVRQTYNAPPQGTGDGGSFCDPPTNRVVCWYYSATLAALAAPAPAPGPLPTTPVPVPGGGATNGEQATPPGGSTQGATATNGTDLATSDPTAQSTSSTADSVEPAVPVAAVNTSSSDSSALPFLFLAIVAVIAAAGGTIIIRRSNGPSSSSEDDS